MPNAIDMDALFTVPIQTQQQRNLASSREQYRRWAETLTRYSVIFNNEPVTITAPTPETTYEDDGSYENE